MRRNRRLFLALTLTIAALTGPSWASAPLLPGVKVNCPLLPPDCCQVKRINGCLICQSVGC